LVKVSRRTVDKYYNIVVRHLQRQRAWQKTIRRFGAIGVWQAVKKILEICYERDIDPETLDWASMFEKMSDYDTIDSFIKGLISEGYLPAVKVPLTKKEEEELAKTYDELYLESLREELLKLGYDVIKVRDKKQIEKIYRELEKYKKEVGKQKAIIESLEKKIEQLKKEKVAKPTKPPPPIPREVKELKDELRRLWARFVDARMRRDYDTAREILREYARIHEKVYGKPSSMRHGGKEYRYRKLILRNLIAEWRDRFGEIPREEAYLAAEKELLDWMESFLHP